MTAWALSLSYLQGKSLLRERIMQNTLGIGIGSQKCLHVPDFIYVLFNQSKIEKFLLSTKKVHMVNEKESARGKQSETTFFFLFSFLEGDCSYVSPPQSLSFRPNC